MRKIIKNRQIVESSLQRVGDEEPLPAGDILIPLSRWLREADTLQHDGQIGVWLCGKDNPRELKGHLDKLHLIGIDFPKFADGRGYSIARILRDEMGYKGELRALGDILRDQLFYLARCGFDAFEIREDKDIEDALRAFNDFSVTYQAASDHSLPLYRRPR